MVFLGDAAAGLPQRSRISYNLGLLLQQIKRDDEAESALAHALAVKPDNPDYLYALAVFYMQRGRWDRARSMAERLQAAHPEMTAGREMLTIIEKEGH